MFGVIQCSGDLPEASKPAGREARDW